MGTITLRSGRDRPLLQRHPWVFSGAISAVLGQPSPGDAVDVRSASGEWLARGFWNGRSQIQVRLVTWDPDQLLDDAWLHGRIARAVQSRAAFFAPGDDRACRLVFSEADGLPGLIVDRYGSYLALQISTLAMDQRRDAIVQALVALLQPSGIYERNDPDARAKEGLSSSDALLWGEAPPDILTLRPARLPGLAAEVPPFLVQTGSGQKTGSYLDQAVNRARVAAYAPGAAVLDAYCFNGGFSAYAAQAGAAALTLIDASAAALHTAQTSLEQLTPQTPATYLCADVPKQLRRLREEGRQFDLIILDPPKFAASQAQVERAARGYKDINFQALHLLRSGGILATFSCSGAISADLFQKILFGAAVDARREVHLIERLIQSPDHPILLSFPESEYLKGCICRVW